MSYTTRFEGGFTLSPRLTPAHLAYLRRFCATRRVRRDPDLTARRPDPLRLAVGLPIGDDAGYFVGEPPGAATPATATLFGDQPDAHGIIDGDAPPGDQPHVHCPWRPQADALPAPPAGVQFEYVSWLAWLLRNFFLPWGYTLGGEVRYQGEAPADHGRLVLHERRLRWLRDGGPAPSGEGLGAVERGSAAAMRGDAAAAERWFALARERAPNSPEVPWAHGMALALAGNVRDGLAALASAVDMEPDLAASTTRRERMHALLQRLGHGEAALARARELRAAEQYSAALAEYEAYLAVLPPDARDGDAALPAQVGAGLALQGLGDFAGAAARYTAATRAAPADPSGWTYSAYLQLHQLNDARAAVPLFAAAIERGNRTARVLCDQGVALASTGDVAAARAAFRDALAVDADDAIAWCHLGNAEFAIGDTTAAISAFQRCIALADPRCVELARQALALAERQQDSQRRFALRR